MPPRTRTHRENISKAKKGYKVSEETKSKISKALLKEKSPRWKGGLIKRNGYFYVYMKGHPKAESHGYIKRSRLVWYMNTGEWVEFPFCLHHINRNKEDDRIENLAKMLVNEHSKLKKKKRKLK